MPNKDKTGPEGKGSRTGRGLGSCQVKAHLRKGKKVRSHIRKIKGGLTQVPMKGKGGKSRARLKKFKELHEGIEVEMEHTNDPKVAKKIAQDHLKELPDYYSRLDKMEKEGKKAKKKGKSRN